MVGYLVRESSLQGSLAPKPADRQHHTEDPEPGDRAHHQRPVFGEQSKHKREEKLRRHEDPQRHWHGLGLRSHYRLAFWPRCIQLALAIRTASWARASSARRKSRSAWRSVMWSRSAATRRSTSVTRAAACSRTSRISAARSAFEGAGRRITRGPRLAAVAAARDGGGTHAPGEGPAGCRATRR